MNIRIAPTAVLCLAALLPASAHAQSGKPKALVGAYYFDGWNGITNHLTKQLETEYADRKPVWGWKDDTVEIMQKQIDYCADHGIAFWAFDWYYPEGKVKATPLNNALDLYLKSPNRQRLKFCLLVANDGDCRIGPKDWDACCRKWIDLFRQPIHLKLDGRPLLIFFSPKELQKAFGGVEGVRKAFDSLRAKAASAGLPGVAVAACTEPGPHLADLARSGYTLLTGYNYNLSPWPPDGRSRPFQTLIDGNERILNQFAKETPLPYVPVITAGWDRRPWENGDLLPAKMSVWYPDRTPRLVEDFVRLGVRWLDQHPDKTTPQRLLLIYAWNENGEGGYLTPTAKDGVEYLKAVQRAIANRTDGSEVTAATVVTDQQHQWLTEKARQITASVRTKRRDGTIIYMPGVYIGLWPRDCYYLVHGVPQFVPAEDIREIVRLILRSQRPDGMVPKSIGENGPDYVCWGQPPEGDSAQFLVLLTYEYFRRSSDRAFVAENLARLRQAMDSMPRDKTGLIWIDPKTPGTPYGFTDQIVKTGNELFCSLLYWEASRQLAEMARIVGEDAVAKDFLARAALIEKNLACLWDDKSGMYFAASHDCRQIDVWGSAYMVYINFPDPPKRQRICQFLADHYPQVVYAGQVRHLPKGQYWQKVSELTLMKERYMNGAYWGTASGWVAYAIAQVNPTLASKMLGDMIDYYRCFDAYECVNEGYQKFPGYAASVGNPLAAIRRLREEGSAGAR
jgi:hypothetical protein